MNFSDVMVVREGELLMCPTTSDICGREKSAWACRYLSNYTSVWMGNLSNIVDENGKPSLTGTPFFITASNMVNPTTIDSQLARILAFIVLILKTPAPYQHDVFFFYSPNFDLCWSMLNLVNMNQWFLFLQIILQYYSSNSCAFILTGVFLLQASYFVKDLRKPLIINLT